MNFRQRLPPRMSADRAGNATGQSTFFYAQYLGVDLHVHPDLHWVVDYALCAPLPEDWVKERKGEQIFYHNAGTKVSTWAHPLEQVHKDVGGKIMHMRSHNLSEVERSLVRDHMQRKYARMALKLQAVVCIKECGERQFRNQETEHVSTMDPRPAILHVMRLYERAMTAIDEQPPQSYHPSRPRAATAAATSGTKLFSGSSGLSRRALQFSSSEVLLPTTGARTRAQHREEMPRSKPNLLTYTTDQDAKDPVHSVLKARSSLRLEPLGVVEEVEFLE